MKEKEEIKKQSINPTFITVIAAIIFGISGFFAGTKYQESKTPQRTLGNFTGNSMMRAGGGNRFGGMGFAPVNGEILSTDSNGFTVKMQDGSSKIVIISDKTTINKAESANKDDLKAGTKIAVFGTTNSDGSVTAQNIQLNPQTRIAPSPQN